MDTVDGSRDFSYDSRVDGSSTFDVSGNRGYSNGRAPFGSQKQPVLALSPVRGGGTMREYEQQINDLRKENFGLKLRIFYLEERGNLQQPNSVDELDSTSSASSFQQNGRSNQAAGRNAGMKRCASEERSDATDSLVSDDDALVGGSRKDAMTSTTSTKQTSGSSGITRVPFANGGTNENGGKKLRSAKENSGADVLVDVLRKEVTEKTSLLLDAQRAIELALNEKRGAEDRLLSKQQEVEELRQQIQLISHVRHDGSTLSDSVSQLRSAPIQIIDDLPIDRYALRSVLATDSEGRPQLDRDALEELQSKLDEVYREFGTLPESRSLDVADAAVSTTTSTSADADAERPQGNLLRRIQELNLCIQKHFLANRNRQVAASIRAHAELQLTGSGAGNTDADRAASQNVHTGAQLPFSGQLLNLSPCSSSFHSVAGTADTNTTSGSGGTGVHSVATVVKRPSTSAQTPSRVKLPVSASGNNSAHGEMDMTAACRMLIEDFSALAPNDSVQFEVVRRDDETASHSAESQLNRTLTTNASEHELAELRASSNDDADGGTGTETPTREEMSFTAGSIMRENEALRERILYLEQHLVSGRRPLALDDAATSTSHSVSFDGTSNASLIAALMRSKDEELEQLRDRLRSLEKFVGNMNLDTSGNRSADSAASQSQSRNGAMMNVVMRDLLSEIQRLRDDNLQLQSELKQQQQRSRREFERADNESRKSTRSVETNCTLQSIGASVKTSPLPLSRSRRSESAARKSAMRRKSASASRLNTSLGSNPNRSRASATRFDLVNTSMTSNTSSAGRRRRFGPSNVSSDDDAASTVSSSDAELERSVTRTNTLSTITQSYAARREREMSDEAIRDLQRQVELLQAELAAARAQTAAIEHTDAATNISGVGIGVGAGAPMGANPGSLLSTPRHTITVTSSTASANIERSRLRLAHIIDEIAESIPRVAEANESIVQAAQALALGDTSIAVAGGNDQAAGQRDTTVNFAGNQSLSTSIATSAFTDGSSTITSCGLEALISKNFEVFAQFREQLATLKSQIMTDATMTPSTLNLTNSYFESPAVEEATPRLNALRYMRSRIETRREHDGELDASRISQIDHSAAAQEAALSHRATFGSSRMPELTANRSVLFETTSDRHGHQTIDDERSLLEPTVSTERTNTVSLLPSQLDQTYAECLRLHETLLGIRQLSSSLLAQRNAAVTETATAIANDDSGLKSTGSSRLRNLLVTPPETDCDLLPGGTRQSQSQSQSSFDQFEASRFAIALAESERGRLLENVTCALNQIKSLIVGIEDDRVNLHDEFSRIMNEKRELEGRNNQLQLQYNELQADLSSYLEQLETLNAEKLQTLEHMRDAELRVESERQAWQAERRRLELDNSELRQRCSEQLEKVAYVRATHEDMQDAVASAKQESSRLQQELDERSALVEEYQARLVRAEQDLASTGARLNDVTIRYGLLEKQASESMKRERDASSLNDTLERKAAALEREIETLHDAHNVALRDVEERVQLAEDHSRNVQERLEAAHDQLHDREIEIDSLRRQCATQEHERATTWQQLATLNEELDTIRHESHRLLEKVASLHTEKLQLSQRLQEAEAARLAAVDETSLLRSELGGAQVQLDELNASTERLRAEIDRLKCENASTLNLLTSQNDRLASTNDRNAALLNELASAQDSARIADQRASELDYRLRDRAAYATSLEAENARIMKENATMMQALREMVTKCRALEDDHRQFVDQVREREADRIANLIDRQLQTSLLAGADSLDIDAQTQTSFVLPAHNSLPQSQDRGTATSISMVDMPMDRESRTQTRLTARVSYDELAKYAQKQKDTVKKLREVIDRNSKELAENQTEIQRLCAEMQIKNKRISELRAQLHALQRGHGYRSSRSAVNREGQPEATASAPPSALFNNANENIVPILQGETARSANFDLKNEVSVSVSLLDRNANFCSTASAPAPAPTINLSQSPTKFSSSRWNEDHLSAVRLATSGRSASSSTPQRGFADQAAASVSYSDSVDSVANSSGSGTFVEGQQNENGESRRVKLLEAQIRALEEVNRTLRDELVTYERLSNSGNVEATSDRLSRSIALSPMKSFYAHITPLAASANESVGLQTSFIDDRAVGSNAGNSLHTALLNQLADVRSLRENLLRCIDDNLRLHCELGQQRADDEQQVIALKQLLAEQSVLIEQLREKAARRKNKLRLSRALAQTTERQLEIKQMEARQLHDECHLLEDQLRGFASQPQPSQVPNLNTSMSASESGVSFGTATAAAREVEKDRVIERLTAEIELLRGELRYSVELSEKLNANLTDYAAAGRVPRSQTDISLTDLVTKQKQRLQTLSDSYYDRRSAFANNASVAADDETNLPKYRLFAIVKLIDYELLCSQVKQARILLHGVKRRVDSRICSLMRQLPTAFERIKNAEYSTLKEVNGTLEQALHCEEKGHAILSREFHVIDRNQLSISADQPATRLYSGDGESLTNDGTSITSVPQAPRTRGSTNTNSSHIGIS